MKKEEESVQNSDMAFLKGREMVCDLFESRIFSWPPHDDLNKSTPTAFYENVRNSKKTYKQDILQDVQAKRSN